MLHGPLGIPPIPCGRGEAADACAQSFAGGLEVIRTPPRQMQETMLSPLRAAAREISQRLAV
jgi:hypothetical protein